MRAYDNKQTHAKEACVLPRTGSVSRTHTKPSLWRSRFDVIIALYGGRAFAVSLMRLPTSEGRRWQGITPGGAYKYA